MFVALLHGEYIIGGMLIAGILTLLAALAVPLWWWRNTSRSPAVLGGSYLLISCATCLLYYFDVGNFLWFTLSFALTLPWSFVLMAGGAPVESEEQFAGLLLASAMINALAIYAAARVVTHRSKGMPAG